jgi:hypothetical protein
LALADPRFPMLPADEMQRVQTKLAQQLTEAEYAASMHMGRVKVMDEWHSNYQPLIVNQDSVDRDAGNDAALRRAVPWQELSEKQSAAKIHVHDTFQTALWELQQRKKELENLLQQLDKAEKEEAENQKKEKAKKAMHDRLLAELNRKLDKKREEQDAGITLLSDLERQRMELQEIQEFR